MLNTWSRKVGLLGWRAMLTRCMGVRWVYRSFRACKIKSCEDGEKHIQTKCYFHH